MSNFKELDRRIEASSHLTYKEKVIVLAVRVWSSADNRLTMSDTKIVFKGSWAAYNIWLATASQKAREDIASGRTPYIGQPGIRYAAQVRTSKDRLISKIWGDMFGHCKPMKTGKFPLDGSRAGDKYDADSRMPIACFSAREGKL